MRVQTIRFDDRRRPRPRDKIVLGFEGDNLVERLEFILPQIAEAQTAQLMMSGRYANAVLLQRGGEAYYADLTAEIVGTDGEVEAYVQINGSDGEAWHSDVLRLITGALPDVDREIETRYPTAVETMLAEIAGHRAEMDEQEERVEQAALRAEKAAERAEAGGGGGGGSGSTVEIDATLTVQGAAADAKATGEAIGKLSKENENRDLPRIFFDGEFPGAKADGERPVTMTYISRARRFTAYATAKVQGSSSTTFKKKNYTFKLYKDAERTTKMKVAFRNWPEENKFVAKANTIDRTHSRNVVSCRIWADMVRSREGYANLPVELRESPNMGAVDGFPVQIYLNGVYQGLYTWNIPKDDWMMGMDSDLIDQHAIICGEGGTNATTGQNGSRHNTFNEAYPNTSQIISGYDWEDELGTVSTNIRANFKRLSDLIVTGTDEEFRANISTYVDMESLIDVFIFKWLACDVDGLGKNQFLYTYNAGLPWYYGVYDADATWGGAPEGTKFVPYDTVMQDDYWIPSTTGLKNRLFERLWALYTDEVRNRWNAVKHGALSLANIINHFEAFHDVIPVELFAEDSAATTADGYFVTTDDSTHKGFDGLLGVDQNNIQQIRNFAAKRWVYVDNQINLIKCTGIDLSASTLALTAEETAKTLTAKLLPVDCNEPVVWSSDDEAVAVVSGGTVTAIYNGECNITATCGDFSATCAVSVSGLVVPGSVNLADPSSPDWKKGYVIRSDGSLVLVETRPDCTVSNFVPMRLGDVFTVEGCQAIYSEAGYCELAFYDANKNHIGHQNTYTLVNKGLIVVDNGVTTFHLGEEAVGWIDERYDFRYIRFTLSKFDAQTDIDTDNIVIKRNQNGENADAWA